MLVAVAKGFCGEQLLHYNRGILNINILNVRSLFRSDSQGIPIVVYTGDLDATPHQILAKANQRFNITINDPEHVEFVFLRSRWLLEASNYPHFTLACQAFAGFIVGLEALWRACPETFIETTGCPLTWPIFRLISGSKVICYIHYPTITKGSANYTDICLICF